MANDQELGIKAGLLLVDKPIGITSNKLIQKTKYLLQAKKIGHGGTLDPLATGLLPIFINEATKFANYSLNGNKEYMATVKLGEITDTGDREGNIVQRNNAVTVSKLDIENTLPTFIGEINQTPPLYSAIKVQGRPLYSYARSGEIITPLSRKVFIHELELIKYDVKEKEMLIRTLVSKGTYIRTLAFDIGQKLKCGAHLSALRRTQVNSFRIEQALTLKEIEDIAKEPNLVEIINYKLISCNNLVNSLKTFHLTKPIFDEIRFGKKCFLNSSDLFDLLGSEDVFNYVGQDIALYANQYFLGIGTLTKLSDYNEFGREFKAKNFIAIETQFFLLIPKRLISNLDKLNPWI